MDPNWINDPDARSYCPNGNPFVSFAGRQWWINYHWSRETGPWADSTFNSVFDPYLLEPTTDSNLVLQIQPPNDKYPNSWRTSEAVLMDNLGYGQYLVTAKCDAPGGFSGLDPHVVFGIFTYQFTDTGDESPNIHREIDATEVLRRDTPGDAQFMLQPWDNRPPGLYFILPQNTPVITVVLSWNINASGQKYAYFGLWTGDYDWDGITKYKPFETLQAKGTDFEDLIPSHRWERFHLNLWLMHGVPPAGPQAVSITRFLFKPYSP